MNNLPGKSNMFYKLRNLFWNYPDALIFSKRSLSRSLVKLYRERLPLSHFLLLIMVFSLLFLNFQNNIVALLSVDSNTLIEGTVMGPDESGKPVRLSRINPLLNSNVQLERDISQLIYEPLINVDTEGEPQAVLAEYAVLEKGSRYRFKLRPGIRWHDGEPVTVTDVEKTVELLRSMDSNPQTSNLYSRVANKLDIVPSESDPFVFEFVVRDNQIIPGFFEAISFKIMPAHLLYDLTADNITQPDPYINRTPIGTGPYKLSSARADTVELSLNNDYWDSLPRIERIRFKLFATETQALKALSTGQIHGLSSISISNLEQIKGLAHIDVKKSNFIYSQYWAVYFNMGQNGPESLKDVKVRQAISSAINKNEVIAAMNGFAEAASGPIPVTSFAYHAAEKYNYDVTRAVSLLESAGYTAGSDGIRAKGEQRLSFTLVMVNNKDRDAVAQVIKDNLKQVGIEVNIKAVTLTEAVNDHILPRIFDLMFYGVQTLIDPDRYELFHSSQADAPGLNISSYISENKRTQIIDGKTTKVPSVDDDLGDARRIVDETARSKKYEDFQKIIAEEVPAVFLFHPEEFYLVNKRIKGVTMQDITSIEDRFQSIADWSIVVK